MDDMDTVGRYGTVALVRKLTFESVTSYPVDDERTTFGRYVYVHIVPDRRDIDYVELTRQF